MPIICCGINHRTGSLVEREPFQLQRADLAQATADFKRISGLSEVVILATCNRVEFYCRDAVKSDPKESVIRFYRERGVNDADSMDGIYFIRQGTSASRHLFKVVSGLDSPLLGEYQILGQVKDAYSAACSVSGPGRFLHKLFHHAFQIAKLVRSETDIGTGVQGLAGASLELIAKHFDGNLAGKRVLIVGVNSSTEMLLSRLSKEKLDITVANRTLYSAEKIVRPYNARAISLNDLSTSLKSTDMVFSVTSAPDYLVQPEHFNAEWSGSLIAVDLAVPRNIDPQVGDLPGVILLDLDDLKAYLDSVQQERAVDLPYALDLIEEQVRVYELWRKSAVGDSGAALRHLLEIDRKEILRRFRDSFRQGDQKALDAFAKSLYKQFLRRVNNIKQQNDNG